MIAGSISPAPRVGTPSVAARSPRRICPKATGTIRWAAPSPPASPSTTPVTAAARRWHRVPIGCSPPRRRSAPSRAATAYNVYGFDNLFATPPGSLTKCTAAPADNLCTTTKGGWCPHRLWRTSINGSIDRNAITLSRDGSQVYAATTSGFLYALNGTDGTKFWTNPFSAQADTGQSNAGFAGSAPWVNYGDGSIYTAANYVVGGVTHIRLYRLKPTDGTIMYKLDISGDGISSSVLAYDAIYFASTKGKLYRVADSGAAFSVSAGWPLQLWSEKSAAGNGVQTNPNPLTGTPSPSIAVFGSPSIDVTNSLLFVAVNNVFFSVNIATRAINWVEGGWQNGTEADANDVAEYSSPWADPALMTVFVGHGKDQSDTGGSAEKGPRCHRRDYLANGTFNSNTLTSVATTNTSNDLSNPHSSPLVLHEPAPSTAIYVFIGDPGGTLNRWDYETGNFGNLTTFSTGQGKSIDSPIIIDYLAGNIYFGDNSGRVYQISQSSLK